MYVILEELRQAIVAMMLRKDRMEEQNRFVLALYTRERGILIFNILPCVTEKLKSLFKVTNM